ncbi:MAG: hypothetical protein JW821_08400, partial [Deltaproteobacteria bacterium]|nr:hypothetical protein [Deltaproteobacteria bacterium]
MPVANHPDLERAREKICAGQRHLQIFGLEGSARSCFLASLLSDLERGVLILLPHAKDAMRFYRELEFFLPEIQTGGEPGKRRLYAFPLYDISPLTGLSPHKEVVTRRLQALYALINDPSPIVVTSLDAALLRVLPKEALIGALDYVAEGEEIPREELLRRLEANGYLRTSLVEERGDYSVRGAVIDVFPPLYRDPVRLEFWGDRLESLRHFDPVSQRSSGRLNDLVLLPANEIILEKENVRRARSMGRIPGSSDGGIAFPGQEAWLNHFYERTDSLFDYVP